MIKNIKHTNDILTDWERACDSDNLVLRSVVLWHNIRGDMNELTCILSHVGE